MDTSVGNVTKQVTQALMNDRRTEKAAIEVSCTQGICTLTGKVKSPAVMQAAEEIARSQPGVISVINEMKIG